MATIILRSNEVVHALVLFCIFLLVHKGDAYEFVVGGQKGWSVPSDPNSNSYSQWAQKSRFQIGDSLVFNYPSGQDSVIQVNSQDYDNCNTDAYSQKFSDGHTMVKLNQSGPHYFISGNKNNCLKNEKLVVIVLANRNNRNTNTTSPSPSPSPSVTTKSLAPSPAPSQKEAQSPVVAPAQQEAPSPPSPVTSTTPAPAPAPASDQTPPSPHKSNAAASSIIVSIAGSVGAFLVSVLVVSF
ncbi:hypothetical protein Fmac_019170 [Flemingia macrophylla]|uniref:Phytocyanin domain-containing protein n=1 Tax=Flemingia macrophylla TaxID=520843 RepID=A0ABD1M727_9FABA